MTHCPACRKPLALENLSACLSCGHLNGYSHGTPVLCVRADTDRPQAELIECSKMGYVVIRDGKLSLTLPRGFDPTYGHDKAYTALHERIGYGRGIAA